MKKMSARVFVWISLLICLISFIGVSVIQTNFGSVEITELTFETTSGNTMNALLLVPENATSENPAPAIVTSHGWYNNKEMQDLNYVEYARRGFVVLSISMYGHGDSEVLPNNTWWNAENNANGMYDAVKMMATLPYVDASRIGVTGHSNGALASRNAMVQDNGAETRLIAAGLLVSNDAVYYDADKNFANLYGGRDVGIVACQYDEFFHRVKQDNGTTSPPREYINQVTAQSFLNFGADPAGLEKRSSYEYYTQDVDGEEAIRVIFNPAIIHPKAHWDQGVVADSVTFFDKALGAPIKLDAKDQIWPFKAIFNGTAVIGLFMFIVSFALALLDTPRYATLCQKAEIRPMPTGKGKAWYWGGMAACSLIGIYLYPAIYSWCNSTRPAFFNQAPTYYIGMWSLLCGVGTLIVLALSYAFSGKAAGFSFKETGIAIDGRKLFDTIILAGAVVLAAFGVIFAGEYLFKADARIFCITIRAFEPDHFVEIAKFAPFFLVYYIVMSVAVNSFNFVGKKEGANLAIQMVSVAIGPAIMIAIQYGTFFVSGHMFTTHTGFGGSITGIWLFPVVFYLPVAALVTRFIYKKTNNPYIGGIIMGLFVTIVSATNTLTMLV